MHRGYVRDYRKGMEHPLFSRPLIWHFWTYCRLRANYKETVIDFNGMPLRLERGCFLMSVRRASKDTGLSVQNIRSAIKILESHEMIEKSTHEVTRQATIIKVIKYDTYQLDSRTTNTDTNTVLTQCQHSTNTVPTIDNKVNNINKFKKEEIHIPPIDEKKEQFGKEKKSIVDYLNEKAGKKYRQSSQKTSSLINARLKEGFTVDDFKTVIDKKTDEWINTDFEQYLRPETLFGNKFEGYLNQPIRKRPKADEYGFIEDILDF